MLSDEIGPLCVPEFEAVCVPEFEVVCCRGISYSAKTFEVQPFR